MQLNWIKNTLTRCVSKLKYIYGSPKKESTFGCFYFVAILSCLFVFRVLFFATYYNYYTSIAISNLLAAFAYGLFFDFFTCVLILAPYFLLSHIPFLNAFRFFRLIWITYINCAVLLLIVFSFADLMYYTNSMKRLGYEAFVYLDKHFIPIIQDAIQGTPVTYILSFVAIISSIGCAVYVVCAFNILKPTEIPFKQRAIAISLSVCFLLGVGFTWLLPTPIHFSSHMPTNQLALNATYTTLLSTVSPYLNQKFSETVVNSSLNHYPLLKKIPTHKKYKNYNVVIFVMESWSGLYVGPNSIEPEATPYFNKLAQEGLYFPRFFATGYRSSTALFSILTGFPDLPEKPITFDLPKHTTFLSISRLLKQQAYTNYFIHGGDAEFDRIETLFHQEEFDHIVDDAQFDPLLPKGDWGIHDEYVFQKTHQIFAKEKQPFFGFIFSASSHYPYVLPHPKLEHFPKSHPESAFLNALRYSDWSLHQFFLQARKQPYFKDTIFIVTADHTHHGSSLNIIENQRIPLLIYAPGIIKPERNQTIGSHVDILPTLAGLLNIEQIASMGQDLLHTSNGKAYWVASEYAIGWCEKELFGIFGLQKQKPLVFNLPEPSNRQLPTRNLAATPQIELYEQKAKSYLKKARFLFRTNRIAPVHPKKAFLTTYGHKPVP